MNLKMACPFFDPGVRNAMIHYQGKFLRIANHEGVCYV